MRKLILIALIVISNSFSWAINPDSLLTKAREVLYDYPQQAIQMVEPVLVTGNKEQLYDACSLIGDGNYLLGDLKKSQLYYERSLQIAKQLEDDNKIAQAYLGIGTVIGELGRKDKAMELLQKALKIQEERGDKKAIAEVLNNIANLFGNEGNYETAIEYMTKVLAIDKENNDSSALGFSYSNLGAFHYFNSNNDSALYYHRKALEVRSKIGGETQKARTLNNIANVLIEMGRVEEGISTYKRALEIHHQLDNQYQVSFVLNNLGESLQKVGRNKEALPYILEANSILDSLGDELNLVHSNYSLAKTYFELGKYKEGFLKLNEAYEQRKKLFEEERSRQAQEMMTKFETERTEKENEELRAKRAEDSLMIERTKNRTYLLVGSLLILALLSIMIFSKLQSNRKNTKVLKGLYDQLEQKNTDIVDSIHYAQRIQKAILPPDHQVKSLFEDSFVLYKPKDVVAGDFYWVEQTEGSKMIAAADCTGHGVPGAMVSVICNGALNRAVREYKLRDPAKILDKAREIVIKEFEKSEEEVKDGMDIALITLEKETGNEKIQLRYAGAHNPLWVVSKNTDMVNEPKLSERAKVTSFGDCQLIEIKADKQPIGKFHSSQSFTSHKLELEAGDTIYIFSDGFNDQFGGEKGKKLKASNFKKLLIDVQHESLPAQKKRLEKEFENWKGDLDQLDDVCVIGVRLQ